MIFIGRWVKQKGVDHIAELAPAILRIHPEVQIVLAGKADDACGMYAQELLAPLLHEFRGRLFLCTEFFRLSDEMRRGAHLCFAPSCSEPFGYVDVEFGLLGVPSVGCAVGGLGKMPGVYFRQQNSDSNKMLLEAFFCAVHYALKMPDREYWEMAKAATMAAFPYETWRDNLNEAYLQAMRHFKHKEGESHTMNHMWGKVTAKDAVKQAMTPRRPIAFGHSDEATDIAQTMQVLDVQDNAEFLTQAVTEKRTHKIMRGSMAQEGGRRYNAESLQSSICQAEQRRTEKSHVTLWLMKPFAFGLCLRIHVVIALCYIFSSVGETVLKAVTAVEARSGLASEHVLWSTFYGGAACGCCLWLCLSRGLPPNLLMAGSQIVNLLFFMIVPSLPEHAVKSDWVTLAYWASCGVQSTSRLLFIIWNFNEDFHGGFQVACKRIGILESLRTAAGMLSVIVSLGGMAYVYQQIVLIISLTTLILLFKAPQCYCAYSLPPMGWVEGLFTHKSFILLLLSEMLNATVSYTSQTYHDWWVLNGWSTHDIISFSLVIMAVSALVVPFIFAGLQRVSVWGPWPMRDFTCFLPPGSLLRALALYDLGYLHHRSYLFAAALIASYCIDVLRSASVFASMMAVLGNKWYALKGCYIVIAMTSLCSCASPFVGRAIAVAVVNTSPFQRVTLDKPVSHSGSLGEAVFWAVVPLTLAAYFFQLVTLRYFNSDILTYRGHGNLLPTGAATGASSTMHRVPITALRRMHRAARKPRRRMP
uniref:Uncharacterized protein n=1 Tax=Zooxanthella nutricula TaxID=1333877 RepID=A0A7S2NN61_9DINO